MKKFILILSFTLLPLVSFSQTINYQLNFWAGDALLLRGDFGFINNVSAELINSLKYKNSFSVGVGSGIDYMLPIFGRKGNYFANNNYYTIPLFLNITSYPKGDERGNVLLLSLDSGVKFGLGDVRNSSLLLIRPAIGIEMAPERGKIFSKTLLLCYEFNAGVANPQQLPFARANFLSIKYGIKF